MTNTSRRNISFRSFDRLRIVASIDSIWALWVDKASQCWPYKSPKKISCIYDVNKSTGCEINGVKLLIFGFGASLSSVRGANKWWIFLSRDSSLFYYTRRDLRVILMADSFVRFTQVKYIVWMAFLSPVSEPFENSLIQIYRIAFVLQLLQEQLGWIAWHNLRYSLAQEY